MKKMATAIGLACNSTKVRLNFRLTAHLCCLRLHHSLQCHAGSQSDAGGEIVEISTDTDEVWLTQGSKEVFMEKINLDSLLKGDLTKSYAHWRVPKRYRAGLD